MISKMRTGLTKRAGVWLMAVAVGFICLGAANGEETSTAQVSSTPPYSLAVFPWRMVGVGSDLDSSVWIAFRHALQETGLFSLKYSYYPTMSGLETRMISRDLLNESMERDLWVRKNMFEWFRPDVSLISSIARKLNVDAVLMYSIDRGRHWITAQAFLVDVRDGRVFSAKIMDSPSRPELFRAPIRGITLRVFREFQASRTQGG